MQKDLFRGLRFFRAPDGKVVPEMTVAGAADCTGLSTRSIIDLIDDGDIRARQPGANRRTGKPVDSLGRKKGYKLYPHALDVYRIAYGVEEAHRLLTEMGFEVD